MRGFYLFFKRLLGEKKLSLIIVGSNKFLALLSYFLLSRMLVSVELSKYLVYFSSYQLGAQVIALQLPVMFFRYSKEFNFDNFYRFLLNRVLLFIVALTCIFVIFNEVSLNSRLLAIPAMLLLFVNHIFVEYIRGNESQIKSFLLAVIPTISYVFSLTLVYLGFFDSSFQIVLLEIIFLSIIPIYTLFKYKAYVFSYRINFKFYYDLWNNFSRYLYINGVLWYVYFNLPVLVLQGFLPVELYNTYAVNLRLLVALSTISSMISIVYQKEVITIYENSEGYLILKSRALVVYKYLTVAFLLFFVVASLGIIRCQICLYVAGLLIFLMIYFLSNFIIAQRDTYIITSSMLVGFGVAAILFISLLVSGNTSLNMLFFPMFTGLFITYIIRFKMVFYEKIS